MIGPSGWETGAEQFHVPEFDRNTLFRIPCLKLLCRALIIDSSVAAAVAELRLAG